MLPLMLAVAALADLPRPMPDGFPLPPQAIHRFGNRQLRHPDEIGGLAASPDGKLLATASYRCLVVWDAKSLVAKTVIPAPADHAFEPWGVGFVDDSRGILCNVVKGMDRDGSGKWMDYAQVRDVETGRLLHSFRVTDGRSRFGGCGSGFWQPPHARAADDGREIASHESHRIRYYEAATGHYLRQVSLPSFNWNWRYPGSGHIPVRDPHTGKPRLYLWRDEVKSHCVSDDHTLLTWQGNDDRIHVRDLVGRRPTVTLDLPPGFNLHGWFVPAGGKWLYGWSNGSLVKWDLEHNRPVFVTTRLRDQPSGFVHGHDGRILFCSTGGLVRRLNADTGAEIPAPSGVHAVPPRMALTPDGTALIVADGSSTVVVKDLLTGRDSGRLSAGQAVNVDGVAVSPDGKLLALGVRGPRVVMHGRWPGDGGRAPKVRLVERATGHVVWEREPEAAEFWGLPEYPAFTRLAFDRDGKLLMAGTSGRMGVFRVESGMMPGQSATTGGVAIDPNLTWFATADGPQPDSRIWRRFDPTTGDTLAKVEVDGVEIESDQDAWTWVGEPGLGDLIATLDGRRLITSHQDGSVRWWDPHTGKELHREWRGPRLETILAVSDDGRYLALAGKDDPSVVVWEMASRKPVLTLTGNLTASTQMLFTRDGRGLVTNADMAPTLWSLRATRRVLGTPDDLWKRLASTDAAEAYAAQWALVARPAEAVKLLGDRLRANDLVLTRAMFDQWVADLDSPRFAVRESAHKALSAAAPRIPAAWLDAAAATTSEETRSRIGRVRSQPEHPDHWRLLRAASVLKWIDTPESKGLLKQWTDAAEWLQ